MNKAISWTGVGLNDLVKPCMLPSITQERKQNALQEMINKITDYLEEKSRKYMVDNCISEHDWIVNSSSKTWADWKWELYYKDTFICGAKVRIVAEESIELDSKLVLTLY